MRDLFKIDGLPPTHPASGAMSFAQEHAEAYWADKTWKKFVVTLERGPTRQPQREVKFVRALNRSGAIACARRNAFQVRTPSRVACRLATAYDLGCTGATHG